MQLAAEETAEERIARLKAELEEAQREAESTASNAKNDSGVYEFPSDALVVIEGHNSAGSGFIAEMRGRTFLVTNIHVLGSARGARFETLNGTSLSLPNVAFLSEERDIAIIPIEWTGARLETGVSLKTIGAQINDPIVVCGNSDGAGVATQLKGKISGIGPAEIEITAKFIPGNSGSPIIHSETGHVIGIASYLRDFSEKDRWTEDSELKDIRRFGFRFDGNIKWQRFPLDEVYQQGEAMATYEERTGVLAHTVHMMQNERTIMTGYHTHDSLGYLFDEVKDGFSWRRGTSSSNNTLKLDRFVKGLRRELITDRASTEESLSIKYYQNRFSQIDPVRDIYLKELEHPID